MKIYVASSWRNLRQPAIVDALREDGHEVYDFKNPAPGNNGFAWAQIHPNWEQWTTQEYIEALNHPVAQAGFKCDMNALTKADATVLVMPCGRSAHLELGFAVGHDQFTYVLSEDMSDPELMYLMCDGIFATLTELRNAIAEDDKILTGRVARSVMRA